MARRSPARWLAPLALLAAAGAVALVVAGPAHSPATSAAPSTDATTTTAPAPAAARRGPAAKRRTPARTYVVRAGDTLSAVSARTGVPLARLQQLNPGVDSAALHVGQRLRVGAGGP